MKMNFHFDVLVRSESVPVVVDFWASWCQPCRILGPIIEELATKAKGKWELVKVSTEENPELMQRFGIQGIPAVKMFFKGSVIAEFTGALPQVKIQEWLNKNLPSEEKELWLSFSSKLDWPPTVNQFEELEDLLPQWKDIEEAEILYVKAAALMNTAKAIENPPDNLEWKEKWKGFDFWNMGEDYWPWKEKWNNREWESLIELLLGEIMAHTIKREEARKALVLLFALLGENHPLSLKFRRRFSMAMY
jgi:putative thioredoxin